MISHGGEIIVELSRDSLEPPAAAQVRSQIQQQLSASFPGAAFRFSVGINRNSMNTPTLIIQGDRRLSDCKILTHSSELPPGLLTESEVARWLDQRQLDETERRSYYSGFQFKT